jgi:predicted metal-binding protein
MAGKMENDMKKLCDLALDSGGTAASCFEAKDVVIDERTRLKCIVPVCDDYGVNLMCPPNVMSVAEFASILSRYDVTILIQVGIAVPEKVKNMIENGDENLSELYNNKVFSDNYRQTLTKARKLLHEIVNKVESAAFSMGYNFAAGLIGGSCRLCGNCVKAGSGEPCRHPFLARPSMEAMGIDVARTAVNAGLPFDIPPKETAVWNGLVLID